MARRHVRGLRRRIARPRVMIVDEQPGDQKDLAGRPFVGPAGRVLDEALSEAGIDRRRRARRARSRCLLRRPAYMGAEGTLRSNGATRIVQLSLIRHSTIRFPRKARAELAHRFKAASYQGRPS